MFDGSEGTVTDEIKDRYTVRLGFALLVAVALLVVLGVVVQAQTAGDVREDAQRNLATTAEIHAEDVDDWMQDNERQVRTVSRLPVLTSSDAATMNDELASVVENDHVAEEVVAINLVDLDERQIVASSHPEAFVGNRLVQMTDPYVPKLRKGFADPDEVYVSKPFYRPMLDRPIVAMLSPVPDSNRVVVFMLNPTGVTQDLRQPIKGGHTHVVTADGFAAAAPGNTTHQGSAWDRAIANAIDGESGFVEMADGTLIAYAPVGSQDWAVLTHVKPEQAYALLTTVRYGLGAMVLIALLTLGLVGATVGRNTAAALRSLAADARELGDGDLDVEFDVDRTDEFGTLASSLAEMRDSLQARIDEAREAREEAERRRERTERLNRHLETKATEYGDALAAIADGDLTRQVEPSAESDAMASVGRSINRTAEDLSAALGEVKAFAEAVADGSRAVDADAADVRRASQEVSESVQEISDGATRQTEMLDGVAADMESLSATAEEAASATDDLASTSERAASAGDEGREAAQAAIAEMNEVESQTERAVRRIETLDDEMAAIGEIVELITDIAEQTNILALNASIEAARAGEAGEGFAVVADEVKNLAEETREAAEDVEERIARVQDRTDATVADIQETRERLATGVDTVEDAIAALEEIADQVEEADAGVQEISQAAAEQARTAQSVAAMVDDLATISRGTTEEARTVAAAVEQQTATLVAVSDRASGLSTRADELQSLLVDFEVDESRDRPGSARDVLPAEDD